MFYYGVEQMELAQKSKREHYNRRVRGKSVKIWDHIMIDTSNTNFRVDHLLYENTTIMLYNYHHAKLLLVRNQLCGKAL